MILIIQRSTIPWTYVGMKQYVGTLDMVEQVQVLLIGLVASLVYQKEAKLL